MPYSQLPYGAFHLHVSVSLLTLSGLNTSKWMELIIDAETHLVDLHAPIASSRQWSVVSDPEDQTPHIIAWLAEDLYLNDVRDVQVVILVRSPASRKTHCSEIQRALLLCFQGATFLTVRKPFLMLTLHCPHQAWTFARNFCLPFFVLACFEAWPIPNSLTRDQTLKSPNHWATPGNPPQWILNMGLLRCPLFN